MNAVGDHDIEDFNWEKAYLFEEYLKKNKHAVNMHQRHLQVFLNWAHSTKRMRYSVNPPKVPKTEHLIKSFSRSQVEIYKKAVIETGNINFIRIFFLAYYHIMRASEIWSLPLRNIFLADCEEQPYIAIENVDEINWIPKSGKPREVDIHNDKLLNFLKDDISNSGNDRFWYVDDGHGNQGIPRIDSYSYYFSKIRDSVGLPKYEPLQSLRRTGITLMVEAGGTMADVHDMSGHFEIQTTEKYYRRKRRRSGSKAAVNLKFNPKHVSD